MRQRALSLAAAHDQHLRRVRRRALLFTLLCAALVLLLTIWLVSMLTDTSWFSLPTF